ncbi:MAG: tRNA uridine-5-carboxymethylaminomethyl(34) synthesis enzyme MnmG [Defluviitaleaceae bacterium]|nr:tRNA uridine-5-carboxymethylaminomethyl(34) synthesis enzyme MnmG [Defluviitaleaceae bacterium]
MLRDEIDYDIIIVGAGHAGCEAALACARLGLRVAVFALNLDSVALMPCNPSIGGTSKGHLVRELDALGGEMGRVIDRTYIQSRMLNLAKGPAVYSLRAQADKHRYSALMKSTLESCPGVSLRQAEVTRVVVEAGTVTGVVTDTGRIWRGRAVVLATGTYLRSRCLVGEVTSDTGPNGLKNSSRLAVGLEELGVVTRRFKTGTPARVNANTLDFSKMEAQYGDEPPTPFSFRTIQERPEGFARPQVPCYLTYTSEATHDIIRANLHRSPMYSGVIEGTGTRYCPSIEDKVVRFADKPRHQLFIEPEGEGTCEVYVAGMSTSLPEDVQTAMYRTVPGMENCEIMRLGYAIEYDCIDPTQLDASLGFKEIPGLFAAGQFNGSSGYEEAAAQGLVAGINAARFVLDKPPLILRRSDAYIGVLIDDLCTKGTNEPYRMMTSRAEYRLLLRQDNADLRLTHLGHDIGLVGDEQMRRVEAKRREIEAELARIESVTVAPAPELNEFLSSRGSSAVSTGVRLAELVRRPELDYDALSPFDRARPSLGGDVREQVNIQCKYDGYIRKQMSQVAESLRLESMAIPPEIDYSNLHGLRIEARQKLDAIRPKSVGQASRISGVSPADISVILIHLKYRT